MKRLTLLFILISSCSFSQTFQSGMFCPVNGDEAQPFDVNENLLIGFLNENIPFGTATSTTGWPNSGSFAKPATNNWAFNGWVASFSGFNAFTMDGTESSNSGIYWVMQNADLNKSWFCSYYIVAYSTQSQSSYFMQKPNDIYLNFNANSVAIWHGAWSSYIPHPGNNKLFITSFVVSGAGTTLQVGTSTTSLPYYWVNTADTRLYLSGLTSSGPASCQMKGGILEFRMYNGAHSPQQQMMVRDYLKKKFGVVE